MSDTVNIDPLCPSDETVRMSSQALKNSGIIVYPTDTAYGLGVNCFDEKALAKLYKVKNRDTFKPTHIVVRDWEMITNISHVNNTAEKIYKNLMPGPITIILKKTASLPDNLTAGLPTIGIRIPNYPFTRSLSKLVEFPYTTPSANKQSDPTPYSIDAVTKSLQTHNIELIIDAGVLPKVAPSTIVDITENNIRILREGPVKKSEIIKTLSS